MIRIFSEYTAIIILLAFILDCIIGDPQNPLHPIRLIGNGIYCGIKAFKKSKIKKPIGQFIAGAVLVVVIVCLSFGLTRLVVWGFYRINWWVGLVAEAVICYFLIAAKALKVESMKVYHALAAGDLQGARKSLSYIVGRETKNLNEKEIVKAAVETVAENLSDGVIAPLIFIFIGGAPLGMAYKAINTLDSMIGYRNEDYEYFGKFAARLDDVVNFIPARLSALIMILGSMLAGGDIKMAIKIYARDRRNHKSPNSAQTESVCAGALGLCLGGDSYYHGKLVHKPTIGDDVNTPVPAHIKRANRLMYVAVVITVIILAAASFAIGGLGYV
ncbi:MAG: adenosylcobinamide-phosphate synthase CbiB [Defluviitaleaceae bacterium]|nr:adenosylcobinamide-phosphate synthase CbiB [Defluviitaleaceae bacterium]